MKWGLLRACFVFYFILSAVFQLLSAEVKIYNVSETHGLNLREAASVCSDDEGFIWASSKTGIVRLKHNSYDIYRLPLESPNIIWTKLVFDDSRLYAYTNNGQIFKYNTIMNRFDLLVNIPKTINQDFYGITNVLVGKNNSLWIATFTGLFRYNGKLSKVYPEAASVFNITYKNSNELIFVTPRILGTLDIRSHKVNVLHHFPASFQVEASKLFFDPSSNKLWMGTFSSGLYFYNFSARSFYSIPVPSFPKQPILAITPNTDSTCLVGIDGGGVWELSKNGDKVLSVLKEDIDNPNSLQGNGVYDIYKDAENRVWICTFTGGLSYYDVQNRGIEQIRHQAGNKNSLVNNSINRVLEDKNGKLWFATNNGLSSWEPQTNRWKTYLQNNETGRAVAFLSLCEDNNGHIWAGTYSSGVYVIDAASGRELNHYFKKSNSDAPANNFVFDIFKDSEGDIWIGGLGEIFCYVEKEQKFRTYSYQAMFAFAQINANELLLATSDALVILNKKTGTNQKHLEGHLFQDIVVKGDKIYLMTIGDGLLSYNLKSKKTDQFTVANGLPSDYINSGCLSEGYIWLGTENGICKFNPANKSVTTLSGIPALSNIAFNRKAITVLKDGNIVFGSNKGAFIFSPDSIFPVKSKARIFVNDITVSGISIRNFKDSFLKVPIQDIRNIKLNFDQNNFTVDLIPLGSAISGSKFSWKLEGFDKDWSQPTGNNLLTYTNLPSGFFELKLRLYNSSLSEIIAEHSILFTITPPFWRTWWFLLLVVLCVLSGIYFSLSTYINRLKHQHAEDKLKFFTNTAHDIRNSLTLVKGPIDELSRENELSSNGIEYLSMAKEQVNRLSMVATQLLDFQKVDIGREVIALKMTDIVKLISQRVYMFQSLADAKSNKIIFKNNIAEYCTAVDESMIEKVIDNLLSNAIKYSTNNTSIDVIFNATSQQWSLSVSDVGIGINKLAQKKLFKEFYRSENAINSRIVGSGIGLLLAKSYVGMHDGKISFVSEEGAGSTFTIEIPFKTVGNVYKEVKQEYLLEKVKDKQVTGKVRAGKTDTEKALRVLVVEDNEHLRRFIKMSLENEFEIIEAENGEEAWKIIKKQLPDLVISDIMMENMDGHELCKTMKATYETSHIPIILLTALSEKQDELYGLGLGADDYLSKPFDISLLIQRIKTIIINRKIVRDKALRMINRTDESKILENEHNDLFVKKALEMVYNNLDNLDFGKDEFAKAMLVSPSLLYKKIKALTDQSPSEFIKAARLNHALELLKGRRHTVLEISEKCGFSTVAYFSSSFKKNFGVSPSDI
ncbi:hybrid sensor histidine kinase/response regulator transcription factor [Niabella aquatica]